MRRRHLCLALVAVLVVLAGCRAPAADPVQSDPITDQLGWEDGYWHDDSIAVNASNGLTERERQRVVARTMARVEHLRRLEFTESVSVEVISRETYRERYAGSRTGTDRWNEQVWEALFLIGEDTSIADVYGPTVTAGVQGFYSPASGDIVLVSDSDTPTIDRRTLAHELVHAVQDQQFGLDTQPRIRDRRVGRNGVVEGDANYVAQQYENRCEQYWDCLPRPERRGASTSQLNQGVFLTIYAPYATGPSFVGRVHERDGWPGVNALYQSYPTSSEQLIHPEKYPGEKPTSVTVPDRSRGGWERFDHEPVGETVGEAGIYAMFWATGRIDRATHGTYDYDHRLSAGWAGDQLVPYRNGNRSGYVWQTVWDTRTDARQFEQAYRGILDNRSARTPGANTYVLPDSDAFGDAFRVTRDGKRVRIVNAPTVTALGRLHPPN